MMQSGRLLFVDDDELVRRSFERTFNQYFDIDLADGPGQALSLAQQASYDVIATDFQMPAANGLHLSEELRGLQPDATYMLISGAADLEVTREAINEYSLSYVISKPWVVDDLLSSLRRGFERAWERKGHRQVAAQAMEAARLMKEKEARLRQTLGNALEDALLGTLELRDAETQSACRRVAEYATILADHMGINEKELQDVRRGALLHDIGKIGIPDAILLKEGPLNESEWSIMRTHTIIGGRLIENIDGLEGAKSIVEQHHEKWNGTGYPRELAGEDICIGARILAVVDTLDAILSDRPYRKGAPFETARDEIIRCCGTQFDPAVVKAFLDIPEERWLALRPDSEKRRVS